MEKTKKVFNARELREKRDKDIRKEYGRLRKEKHLDHDHIVTTLLSPKFYLTPSTIEMILMEQGLYKPKPKVK